MSRRHDQSYKLLFSLPLAIEHMIRRFIDDDLAGELDFERAENLATEQTTPGLVRSQADMLWKIHFRGSSRHLLLPVEFQSATERLHVGTGPLPHRPRLQRARQRKGTPQAAGTRRNAAPDARGDDLQRPRTLGRPGRHLRPDRAGAGLAGRAPAEAAAPGA